MSRNERNEESFSDLGKRPTEKLSGPSDYNSWKYLLSNFFLMHDEMSDIFLGEVEVEETEGEFKVTKNESRINSAAEI